MMKNLQIELIFPDKNYTQYIGEVKTLTVFMDNNNVIDEEGLYSLSTFGSLGSEDRSRTFGFIDLNTDMVHPVLWQSIMKIKTLYSKIANGTEYAIFDNKINDFIPADMATGDTGYNFFVSHIEEIDFGKSESTEKANIIKVLKKYIDKGKLFNSKLLVLPAGFREFTIDDDNRLVEDEINDIYRKILNQSKLLKQFNNTAGTSNLRFKLQILLDELLAYLDKITDGKSMAINKSWASKAVEYVSRTVLTSIPYKMENLKEIDINAINYCDVGLLQYIKSIDPLTKHHIVRQFLGNVFPEEREDALLVNDKMESHFVDVPIAIYERWTTLDGLDSVMNSLKVVGIGHEPIMIGDYYLAILVDKGDTIEYYSHSDLIPKEDLKYVRPIRYGEFFYIAIADTIGDIPGTVTRYPVIEQGSTPPTINKPNTTSETKVVKFIDHVNNREIILDRYPIEGKVFINSISISHAKYSGLTADNDGDQIKVTSVMTEDAKKELVNHMDSIVSYVGPDGRPLLDVVDKIADFTMKSMCKRK